MRQRIVCILGPTGVGKNSLALNLAESFSGEIINFDSRQVYADFPLITAQPSLKEIKRCPHHLYGFLSCNQKVDAAEMASLVADKITEVRKRNNLPILVGGTGLYLQALLFGLAPIPRIPEEVRRKVLQELREVGQEEMYNELQKVDPKAAERIHLHDWQRLSRALEVYYATGRTITWWQESYVAEKSKYNYLKLGLWMELEELTPLLEKRIQGMLAAGALREAEDAWAKCSDLDAPGWTGIGCRELSSFLNKESSFEQALEEWKRNTRAYAKRQLTWFKKEKDINWLQVEEAERARQMVWDWLDYKSQN